MRKNFCGVSALVLTIALLISCLAGYFSDCGKVREGVLRLHITANSDSDEDQAVKLKVRDALLDGGAGIFDGSVTAAEAEEKLAPKLARMEEIADKVLAENGFEYTSRAYLVNEYFDVREYDGITLPAGEYTALRVALGSGTGKNWWCVMFPPLCIPAVTRQSDDEVFAVFRENGEHVVKAKGGYKVRFKIAEVAEKIIEKLRKTDDGG